MSSLFVITVTYLIILGLHGFMTSHVITEYVSKKDKTKIKMFIIVSIISAVMYALLPRQQFENPFKLFLMFFTLGFSFNIILMLHKWLSPVIILIFAGFFSWLMFYLGFWNIGTLTIWLITGYAVCLFMRIYYASESSFLSKVLCILVGLLAWLFLTHTILDAIITI